MRFHPRFAAFMAPAVVVALAAAGTDLQAETIAVRAGRLWDGTGGPTIRDAVMHAGRVVVAPGGAR